MMPEIFCGIGKITFIVICIAVAIGVILAMFKALYTHPKEFDEIKERMQENEIKERVQEHGLEIYNLKQKIEKLNTVKGDIDTRKKDQDARSISPY